MSMSYVHMISQKSVAAPIIFMIYICKYVEICKVNRKELHQFGSPGLGTTWRVKKPRDPDSNITSPSAVFLNKEDSLTWYLCETRRVKQVIEHILSTFAPLLEWDIFPHLNIFRLRPTHGQTCKWDCPSLGKWLNKLCSSQGMRSVCTNAEWLLR